MGPGGTLFKLGFFLKHTLLCGVALHVLHASSKSPLEASGPKNAIIGPFVTAPYLELGTRILTIWKVARSVQLINNKPGQCNR